MFDVKSIAYPEDTSVIIYF